MCRCRLRMHRGHGRHDLQEQASRHTDFEELGDRALQELQPVVHGQGLRLLLPWPLPFLQAQQSGARPRSWSTQGQCRWRRLRGTPAPATRTGLRHGQNEQKVTSLLPTDFVGRASKPVVKTSFRALCAGTSKPSFFRSCSTTSRTKVYMSMFSSVLAAANQAPHRSVGLAIIPGRHRDKTAQGRRG